MVARPWRFKSSPGHQEIDKEIKIFSPFYLSIFVVHWLQRLARRGISLRHSGHFLVVGSLAFLVRAIKMFIGLTTKKNIALATRMKEMRVLRKWP